MVEGGANSWPRETRGRITWRDVEQKKKKKKLNGTLILLRQFKSCVNFQQKYLSQTTYNKLQTGSTKLTNDNTEKNLINLACRWLERDGVQLILSKLCGVEKISRRCWLSVFMTS